MACNSFGEDDPFADENGAGAPDSPPRVVLPRDLDMQEVHGLGRVRRETLAKVIEEKRAVAKALYAAKCAASVSAPVMEVTLTPGARSRSILALPPAADALLVVSDTVGPSATLLV